MLPLHQSPETANSPIRYPRAGMRGGSKSVVIALLSLAVLALSNAATAMARSPIATTASARDLAATHVYLRSDYELLHTTVGNWSRYESKVRTLDAKFRAECPHVGAGSPQSEEEQKFSLEVAGALWATGFDTNAAAVRSFVKPVARLRWSNSTITRDARALTKALAEMVSLEVPPLCADVKAWAAGGFQAVPADVASYAKHAEAIEVHQVPFRLLRPYATGADAALAAKDEKLNRRFEELEFVHGQDEWNELLEVLSLNQ